MAVTTTQLPLPEDAKKTRSVFDSYDNLISVIKYDENEKIDYVLKPTGNIAGEFKQTKKFEQVQVDIVQAPSSITGESATLRARIYKNNSSKIYETGFVYWQGSPTDNILGKDVVTNVFQVPSVVKGNFSIGVSNLQDSTQYNYRAYVKHEYGTNYSPVAQFTTVPFTSIFSIVGNRYSGPAPLTVTLTAVNAGFGPYTYAWNMTGGPISFLYSLNSVNVTFSGSGYTPLATNYILESVTMSVTGNGYDKNAQTNVLVNGIQTPGITPEFGLNTATSTYGITSVTIPVALSGFQVSTLAITFSSANNSTITQIASGLGTGGNYTIPRETIILVDGTYYPSLSVRTYQDEETGVYAVSSIDFLVGPLSGFTTSSRTLLLSSNGPVTQPATVSPVTTIQVQADYLTQTVTHTYSAGGNQTAKVYALFDDVIQKEAIRVIRVNAGADFTPEWANVLAAPFANNIIAAYDFRNYAGSINLNEYPMALYDFEPSSSGPYNEGNSSSVLIDRAATYGFGGFGFEAIGGYLFYSGNLPQIPLGNHPIFGYPIAGYDYSRAYGPGVVNGGRAARFDPIGGYGQSFVANAPVFVFNSRRPFTVSMWVNYEEFKNPGTKMFSVRNWRGNEWSITQSPTALNIFRNIFLSDIVSGYLTSEPVAGYFNGFPVLSTTDPAKMLTPKTWNHIVISRDNLTNYKYYLNGTLALTGRSVPEDTNLGIGGYDGFDQLGTYSDGIGGYAFIAVGDSSGYRTSMAPPSGRIDSVAIWGQELKPSDVVELYNGGQGTDEFGYLKPVVGPKLWLGGLVGNNRFPNIGGVPTRPETDGDPYWDNVSLYLKFDGADGSTTFTDSSLAPITLSSNGAYVSTTIKRYGTGAASFSGGRIETPANSLYGQFGREDFTIEWWEYMTGTNRQFYPIIFYGNPGVDPSGFQQQIPQWGILYRAAFGGLEPETLTFYRGSQTIDFILGTGAIGGYKNTWVHNAIQREMYAAEGTGTCSKYTYFRNGQIAGYYNICDDSYYGPIGGYPRDGGVGMIGGAQLGGYWTSPSTPTWINYDGYLDEIRITKGVARYFGNFTVPASSYPTEYGTNIGTRFRTGTRNGSYATAKDERYGIGGYTRETVAVTYPHTIAFVAQADVTQTNDTVLQAIQPNIRTGGINDNQRLESRARSFLGLQPWAADGQNSNQAIAGYTLAGYMGGAGIYLNQVTPVLGGYSAGAGWFYIAYSFLGPNNGNNIRYFVKNQSLSGTGIIGGYANALPFNGLPMFGIGGYSFANPIGGYTNINGVARLGVYINQAFPQESDMLSLYKTITAGPASNIPL